MGRRNDAWSSKSQRSWTREKGVSHPLPTKRRQNENEGKELKTCNPCVIRPNKRDCKERRTRKQLIPSGTSRNPIQKRSDWMKLVIGPIVSCSRPVKLTERRRRHK